MIVLLVLSVAVLGTYIGLLARPIAYGMDYASTAHKEDLISSMEMDEYADILKTLDITTHVKFGSNHKVVTTTELNYEFKADADEALKALAEPGLKTMKEDMETEASVEFYYFEANHKIYMLDVEGDLTNEQYKAAVEEFKSREGWEQESSLEANAFSLKGPETFGDNETTYTCAGSIVIAVVLGLVEVALVTFSVLSVLWFVKSKHKKA